MSPTVLEKNLQLFSKRFEHLHEALKSLPQKEKPPKGLELFTAKNNEISARFDNSYLHSSYNPSGEAKKLMEAPEVNGADSIVFLGVGLGYGVIEAAIRHHSKNIIIIEPDPFHILCAFSTLDWSAVFDCNSLIFLLEAPQQTVITILEKYGLKECFFIAQKAIMQHAEQYFANIQTLVERNLDKQAINLRTLERFSRLWLSNMCKNLPFIENLDGINRYKGMAKNLPACVLAAGPSLDEILPHLEEIKKRCILICVDTALRACLSMGVEPHFILLVDPQYWNARHIEGLRALESILITEAAAYPSVFRFPCKEIILCSSLFPLGKYVEKFTGEKGELGAGGSVATSAWDFARFIGCNIIYMAGLDLSYPNKKTHTKGSTFEEKAHTDSKKMSTSETLLARVLYNPQTEYALDYDGNKTITDSRMTLYAWWFESKCAANPQIKTYNLSKTSLVVPLIETANMEKLLTQKPIEGNIKDFCLIQTISQKKLKPNTIINSLLLDFSDLQAIVDNGIRICNKHCKTDKDYEKNLEALTKIDTSIYASSAKNIVSLVFPTPNQLQSIMDKCLPEEPLPPPRGTYAMAAQYNIQKARILYEQIKNSIGFHIHYLRKNQ